MNKPTLPKGTRDFGPATMAKRQFILNHIRQVFQTYGFQPLETPAMENLDTLTGKYGDEGDQLLFKILNSGDFLHDVDSNLLETRNSKQLTPGISEKGLRYDLTVPFARYVVMNRHDIALPFKRYQIQPVWRADRPQKGRYREFYQCDADVVGTPSLICEVEIILMITEVFTRLGITDYSIKLNHRGILNGIAETLAVTHAPDLFVAIDKLDKIGEAGVHEELLSKDFSPEQVNQLFNLLSITGNHEDKLARLNTLLAKSHAGTTGVTEVSEVFQLLHAYGRPDVRVDFDVALARGLSYYTGCIFEVKINNVSIGSVSGGGRYDNLTQAFGSKEQLSGVGISFGIDRIYDAMEELQLFPPHTQVSTRVLICHFDEATQQFGLSVLAQLRARGIPSEIYPDLAKLKKQLDYANKKQIPFVMVIGPEEMASGNLSLKDMTLGTQEQGTLPQLLEKIPA